MPATVASETTTPTPPRGLAPTHVLAVCLPLLILYITYRTLQLTPGLLAPAALRHLIFGPRPSSPSSHPFTAAAATTDGKDALGFDTTLTHTLPPAFSPPHASHSFASYARSVGREHAAARAAYARLSWRHRRVGWALGYVGERGKVERWEAAEGGNVRVCEGVARGWEGEEGAGWGWGWTSLVYTADLSRPDVGRVREALKHFVRDWSEEGRGERERIFEPILAVLREDAGKEGKKVLVPGCGLGRMAWEVSELGYETTAIEFSAFMTLALRFLLSPNTTDTQNQHTVHPYAYWFSHSRTTANTLRGITFPDVVPRPRPNLRVVEGDFLQWVGPGGQCEEYDYVVTLFFIDTSLNIIATLEHILRVLKPGGTWINLGPLLWTGGHSAGMELSLEEVVRLAEMVGFLVGEEERRTVECEYTADRMAMMRWLYQAEFWVATKPQ